MKYKAVLFAAVALLIAGYATAQKLPIGVDFFGKLRSISSLQKRMEICFSYSNRQI